MAGWLHGVFVGEWHFVFPLCGFSLSLFCNYRGQASTRTTIQDTVHEVYGALLVAMLVVCRVCAESGRV